MLPSPRQIPAACRSLLLALLLGAGLAHGDVVNDVHTLMAKGDLESALRVSGAAMASNSQDAQARFLHAVVLMEMRRDPEALQAFTQISQEYPELPEPFNNLALLHVRSGRLELARQSLEAALRNDPGHRAARANLGEVYLMLAVQAWQQASSNAPLDPRLLRKLEAVRALLASSNPPAR
jgi:Flp pilus assembly protein TadD